MLNNCNFIGNLGADPEIKSFSNGNRVANLRLAVSEHWKDKATGERKEKTEWVSVAIFSEGLIGVAEKYLHKGSKVYISGKMATRKWQDTLGADRYSTEIVLQGFDAKLVMLDGKKSEGGEHTPRTPDGSQGAPVNTGGGFADDLDEDIPFMTSNSVY